MDAALVALLPCRGTLYSNCVVGSLRLGLVILALYSRRSLAAENLFLRKQLALFGRFLLSCRTLSFPTTCRLFYPGALRIADQQNTRVLLLELSGLLTRNELQANGVVPIYRR